MKLKYLIFLALLPGQMALAECRSKMATTTEGDTVVSTNSVVICADGPVVPEIPKSIKIGDVVLENELAKVPEVKVQYFTYKHAKCRLFREVYMWNNKLRNAHGVICQTNSTDNVWQVVDKW